jgi:hypothetical protein
MAVLRKSLARLPASFDRRVAAIAVCCSLPALAAISAAGTAGAQSRSRADSCPEPSKLVWIQRPRVAIPAAKKALRARGRVLQVRRGKRSPYAPQARRKCGAAVVRKSVYVVVHPIGRRCSACNLHAFVVRYRSGRRVVWTAY